MNENGILDNETIRRINKAIEICSQRKTNLIITSGWAYRKDNSNTIGKVVKNYISNNFKLKNCKVLVNTIISLNVSYFSFSKSSYLITSFLKFLDLHHEL